MQRAQNWSACCGGWGGRGGQGAWGVLEGWGGRGGWGGQGVWGGDRKGSHFLVSHFFEQNAFYIIVAKGVLRV